MNDIDDDERLVHWGLEERLGGQRPPDLAAAVQQRLRSRNALAPVRAKPRPWLLVALVLLGVGVVFGVALWPRSTPRAVLLQEPAMVTVTTAAEAAALPVTTRAVEVQSADDATIAALAPLHELEVLVVREPFHENAGMGLKVTPPAGALHVTTACWQTIPTFTKLRRLELSGVLLAVRLQQAHIDPAELGKRLAALPLLETLSLRFLDCDDDALELLTQMASLRRLDLSFNHGFGEAGLEHVLRCRSLRSLSLRGCQQLSGATLAKLAALPELEELDVSLIDGINWRNCGTLLDDTEQRVFERARRVADAIGMGPTDETLAALAGSPHLRHLDIASSRSVTATGLQALGRCASLRELNMFGVGVNSANWVADLAQLERLEVCGDFTDEFCFAVRDHLLHLRRLDIAACYQITDRGLAAVAAMPSLRSLDMGQMYGLTEASLDAVAKAMQLEELDVRNNKFVTARDVVRLRRALPNLRTLQTSVPDADIAASEALPPPVTVRTLAEIEALPGDTRNVIAADIEDEAMQALGRLRRLQRLAIVADWTSPEVVRPDQVPPLRSITDAGLRRLGDLDALREFVLHGELGIEGPGLDVLDHLPGLRLLELQQMKVNDDGLAHLRALSTLRSLSLRYCQGFHDEAMRTIAGIGSLRELSLAGCGHLEDVELARLGALRDLEQLDLSMIGSHTFFSGEALHLPQAEPGSGVTDRVLEAIGGLKRLAVLNLSQADISRIGFRHLHSLPLQTLLLDGAAVRIADFVNLPITVERLSLCGLRGDGAGLGEALAAATPRLRLLDLSGAKVGKVCLESLRKITSLQGLDLSYWTQFSSAPDFNADSAMMSDDEVCSDLEAVTSLETLTIRGWPPLGETQMQRLRAMPKLRRLVTDRGTETLR